MKKKKELLTGILQFNPKGFGFVLVPETNTEYFVGRDDLNGAFHTDTVLICPLNKRGKKRPECVIEKVVERGFKSLVGTYDDCDSNYGFVVCDNIRIPFDVFVRKENSMDAVSGHKVVVEITDYGSPKKNPEGKITKILGHETDPGVDIKAIAMGYNVPIDFNEEVLEEAKTVASKEIVVTPDREDFRKKIMVTIDSEDAKDLDDAVSLEVKRDSVILGVHIADVSEYVTEGSLLDECALERGTSIYLTDRVIPMLPRALSNDKCSLNAGEDRYALSCIMVFDRKGELKESNVVQSVINVNRRMSYNELMHFFELKDNKENLDVTGYDKKLITMLSNMRKLASKLRKKRVERGSIEFDLKECKIKLNKDGRPISIEPYERNEATGLIEEFMLAANESVAEHFFWLNIPFLYRVHEAPDGDKMKLLATFINNFGYTFKGVGSKKTGIRRDGFHPKQMQKLLSSIEGSKEEAMIKRMALRSMMRACYSPKCTGHFGLADKYYCHFTSPIRRYPDLFIHRIIKEYLGASLDKKRIEHYEAILDERASHTSMTEKRADELERECDRYKKVEYMENFIGSEFEGAISGVTGWGFYVELENTVEGLVHITTLKDDYYDYIEERCELCGEYTGRRYSLGMPVKVEVVNADRASRTIDFILAEEGRRHGRKRNKQ
ncbi:MAG: ribonuclease R [Lachnospiraceae bacterium]|nr:ribonuclease R [Lachnospiraceae bacterium]